MATFKELIGDSFEQHSDIDKTAYVLVVSSGRILPRLVKEFIIDVYMRGKEVNILVRIHNIILYSPSVSELDWRYIQGLPLGGGGFRGNRWVGCRIRVIWVSSMYAVVMYMLVIVAPPIVVGARSMAFLLRQHVEYLLVHTCSLPCP